MSDSTRRDFLKQLGIVGLGAAVAPSMLTSACATLQPGQALSDFSPENHIPEVSYPALDMRVVPFQDFKPEAAGSEIEIADPLLGQYLTQPYFLSEIKLMDWYNGPDPLERDHVRRIDIEDYGRFRGDIVETARVLGYSETDLSETPIHDAVMLSGRLVSTRLRYNEEMIRAPEETQGKKLLLENLESLRESGAINEAEYIILLEGLNYTEEARRIDQMPEDSIFREVSGGICRNYASVNSAVFGVLKYMNPNLRNTYMRSWTPEDLSHNNALAHSWNLASAVREGDGGLEVLATFVDPTFLDTRNRTADNSGEIIEISDMEIYNAVDEYHFGGNTFFVPFYLGELHSLLGHPERRGWREVKTAEESLNSYRDGAFEAYMEACERIMDLAEIDEKFFDNPDGFYPTFLTESFSKGAGNMMRRREPDYGNQSTGLESYCDAIVKQEENYGPDLTADPEQFGELGRVYNRAQQLLPDTVSLRNIDMGECRFTREKGDEPVNMNQVYEVARQAASYRDSQQDGSGNNRLLPGLFQ